jgi:septum formation protein
MKLVLASASPRRKQLLAQFGLSFDIITADVDERRIDESPADMTIRLAILKAQTVYNIAGPDVQVLGGDTTVALGHTVLGKPADREEAMAMLKSLSGKTHSVFSAVALVRDSGCKSLLSETRVTFRELSENETAIYCDSGDPYDKAGAYGIQGGAGSFVTTLDGSYSGVVGLPLWHTHQLLMTPAD